MAFVSESPAWADLLADEATWLRRAPVELLPKYLPTLARALAVSDDGARESITSTALADVIATIPAGPSVGGTTEASLGYRHWPNAPGLGEANGRMFVMRTGT